MGSTTKFKARKAIIEQLRNDTVLAPESIDYNHHENRPESISLGPQIVDDDTGIETTKSLPTYYIERYRMDLVLFVASKNTIEENEARADELTEAIYDSIRNDPYLGLSKHGLTSCKVVETDILSGHLLEVGPMTRVDITLELKGRIT